jgi:hypothetical protein
MYVASYRSTSSESIAFSPKYCACNEHGVSGQAEPGWHYSVFLLKSHVADHQLFVDAAIATLLRVQ